MTGSMNCSKSTVSLSGLCERNDIDGVCWCPWTDNYIVGLYAMTSK